MPDPTLTGETTELLQAMIRNECVNDGTPESGEETRNADLLQTFLEGTGLEVERYEPIPGRGSLVARIEGSDPDAPSLCLMGHTDVVPVSPDGWSNDPFGGELIDGEIWGRGAVDMLNLTASMAVAFRETALGRRRPAGDLLFFAVADEEAGSAHGARWVADHHPDAIRCDHLLTESGGLHSGSVDAPVVSFSVGEKGVAWRRLRITGVPGHGGAPYRSDNALVKAAAVIQRLSEYRPVPRFHELWPAQVARMGVDDEMKAALLDPARVDDLLAELPSAGEAALLHACTHTTFAPTVVASDKQLKTNVIPDVIDIDVDIRTMPGEGRDEVDAHLRAALGDDLFEQVGVEVLMDDVGSISPTDTDLWDALVQAVGVPFPDVNFDAQFMLGFTDARVFRELGAVSYGAGLFSPSVDPADFGRRFHGHDERIDVESMHLTTDLWRRVIVGLDR